MSTRPLHLFVAFAIALAILLSLTSITPDTLNGARP